MSKIIAVTRVINASPEVIFNILADPQMHPLIDGSGTVKDARVGGPARLSKGAKFAMEMKMFSVPYRISNKVIVFDEPMHIAWRHIGRHEWHYRLRAVEGGTEVTETWDWSPMGLAGKIVEIGGFVDRNRAAMEKTLQRLAERAEAVTA
jgi:Polyketide cyclase / dehydrase and lipid transport